MNNSKYREMVIELCNKLHCTQEELIGKATRAHVFNQTFLDKPDDRLWNSADHTWWKREGKLGNLVPANCPIVHVSEKPKKGLWFKNLHSAYTIAPGEQIWIVAYQAGVDSLTVGDAVKMIQTPQTHNLFLRIDDTSLHLISDESDEYVILCSPEDVYES